MATIEKRISQCGDVSYRVKVRAWGFPNETATFPTSAEAKKWAREIETKLRSGKYFRSSAEKKHTLGEAINRYLETVLPEKKLSTKMNQVIQLLWWDSMLGKYCLSSISPSLISKNRDILSLGRPGKAPPSNATVNRYMAALSALFTVAVKEWEWADENPFSKVSKLKEPRGRVRFLSDTERERLMDACLDVSSNLYLAVLLCLSTGARKMEIMSLKWENVDFDRNIIILQQTKNGERRTLPLTGKALAYLKIQYAFHSRGKYHKECNNIFLNRESNKIVDIRYPWARALKKAGIVDFKFHDLRHTAASYLAMNGATTSEIAEILGHKTLNMVKRYAHLSDSHLSGVVESMNRKMFG